MKPALRRNRDPDRGRVGGKADRLPSRDEYVMVGVKLGGDPAALGAAYDRLKAGGKL